MTDYIDRDQAIEVVKFYDGDPNGIPWAIRSLKVVPAADVRPVVRGKWFCLRVGNRVYAKCSECETVHDFKSHFCSWCGADMRGKEKDE